MNDTSTFVPDRIDSTLYCSNNDETVVSDMTPESTWRRDTSTVPVASSSSLDDRLGFSRFGVSNSCFESSGGTYLGKKSLHKSGISSSLQFDPIAEGSAGEESSTSAMSGGSREGNDNCDVRRSGQQRSMGGLGRDRTPLFFNSSGMSSYSGVQDNGPRSSTNSAGSYQLGSWIGSDDNSSIQQQSLSTTTGIDVSSGSSVERSSINDDNNSGLSTAAFSQQRSVGSQRKQHINTSSTLDNNINNIATNTCRQLDIVSQRQQRAAASCWKSSASITKRNGPVKGILHNNTRFSFHNPAEVDVVAYYEDMMNNSSAEELASLPKEYLLDRYGNRYHPHKLEMSVGKTTPLSSKKDTSLKRYQCELRPVKYSEIQQHEPYGLYPLFSRKDTSRWHSLITIMAAIFLAAVVFCVGIQSLSSSSSPTSRTELVYVSSGSGGGRYVFLPNYQFGGGIGGLLGGQQEHEKRRLQQYSQYGLTDRGGSPSTGYVPANGSSSMRQSGRPFTSSGSSTRGDESGHNGATTLYGGSHFGNNYAPISNLGPPQFNPGYNGANQLLPILTATPLASYAPPQNDDDATIVLDPDFNGSFMDLSMLPYNPQSELPVVLDVPLSGGGAMKQMLGNCLKLVQCSERGSDILSREYENERGKEKSSRHSLVGLVAKGEEDVNSIQASIAGNKINYLRIPPLTRDQENLVDTPFDPPLKTEVVYTSTFINVDCTTPKGVDRGVAKQLVTSDMADAIYSPNIHDVARLFAPPVNAYGRAVVMLRNPIERSVAKYNWLIRSNEDVKKMSLEEFAKSDHLEDNILTRAIASKPNQNYIISVQDLAVAKEILKRKFIVGLFEHMEESIGRFETFFGWNIGIDARTCQHNEIGRVMSKHYNHVDLLPKNSAVSVWLHEKNRFDMELFEYARFLYHYQGQVLFGTKTESV